MSEPTVAIVGRPNVGKSSLFNWLIGHRVAIVDPTSGVTRDRVTHPLHLETQDGQRTVLLTDTGGMGVIDRDGLTDDVETQIDFAIAAAELILFVVDAQTGPTDLDRTVARRLAEAMRKRDMPVPVQLVANKCDNPNYEHEATAFYKFRQFGDPLFVSVTGNVGKADLEEAIAGKLPFGEDVKAPTGIKIALVGRRNVGKSTFINALAKSERMIVSEVPGTTRDSVDVRFEHNGRLLTAIDTAGVRKRTSLADSIEFYSYARAQRSIRRADVVLFLFDPLAPVSRVDKQLSHYINDNHKPCILVVNKWDLTEGVATGDYSDYLDKVFPMLTHAPRVFTTAKTGRNVTRIVDLCQNLHQQAHARVSTPQLNKVLRAAVDHQPPAYQQNKRPKLYYVTQADGLPPTLVFFCNHPKLITPAYKRYLANVIRDRLPFEEVPVKMEFRRSRDKDKVDAAIALDEDAAE